MSSSRGNSWLKTTFSTSNPLLRAVANGLNELGRWCNAISGILPIVVERQGGCALIRHGQPEPTLPDTDDCVSIGCWDAVGEAVSEGTEAADSTTQAMGEIGQSLRLWMMTRVAYYHAGDKTLYGYVRALTFDAFGHLTHVGAETRVSVDVTEACG